MKLRMSKLEWAIAFILLIILGAVLIWSANNWYVSNKEEITFLNAQETWLALTMCATDSRGYVPESVEMLKSHLPDARLFTNPFSGHFEPRDTETLPEPGAIVYLNIRDGNTQYWQLTAFGRSVKDTLFSAATMVLHLETESGDSVLVLTKKSI